MPIYINVFLTIILIAGLIVIYRKREEREDLLTLKILGYYFLGSFRFNLNSLAIPLGFIIYVLFFRPKHNTRIKAWAAVLGLAFFAIGVAIPHISKYLYERPRQVPLSSMNINKIDFQRDWQLIKEKLEIDDGAKLQEFSLEYNNDGSIRDLRYELVTYKDGGLVHYAVDLIPYKGEYSIRPSKIDQWLQYNRLISAGRFFQVLTALKLEDMKPKGNYEWKVLDCRGEAGSYAMMDAEKFIIDSSYNIKEITNESLPIKGFFISSYGMVLKEKRADVTSYEGAGRTDYFFDVVNE